MKDQRFIQCLSSSLELGRAVSKQVLEPAQSLPSSSSCPPRPPGLSVSGPPLGGAPGWLLPFLRGTPPTPRSEGWLVLPVWQQALQGHGFCRHPQWLLMRSQAGGGHSFSCFGTWETEQRQVSVGG